MSDSALARALWLAWLAWQAGCDPLGGSGADQAVAVDTWSDPVVLVSSAARPAALGQDAQSLYWGDEVGYVRLVSKEGGAVTALYEDVGAAADLAVANDTVFWLEASYGRLQSYSLLDDQIFTLAVGLNAPRRLAFGQSYLYWIDGGQQILRMPSSGGYSDYVVYGAVDIIDLALDDTHLYYGDAGRGAVYAVELQGGAETLVVSALTGLSAVTADGRRVCWSTRSEIACLDGSEPDEAVKTVARGL
ncbi:MAG: hypothetical protein JRI23_05565, partial [Deltaproteobacteria bacterium]|nr:hypothetical protein [Deltaproteobacteria bacterium]MBW2531021.1 hypothetical protein [Deltaproteobacteria bacterium]